MNKLICPLCRNKVEEKGKIISSNKINSDHICCICMDNDKQEWCQLKGCTCLIPPGHKKCLKEFYEYVNGIPSSSNTQTEEEIALEIDRAMINFQKHLDLYKKE